MGRVSLDGTKVHAAMRASTPALQAMSWGHATKLEQQRGGRGADAAGARRSERTRRGSRSSRSWISRQTALERREERLAAIREAKEKIEERAQERDEAERAEYEAQLIGRQDERRRPARRWEGDRRRSRPAGPREKDQVNFTDEGPRASYRVRTGTSYRAERASGGGLRTVIWWSGSTSAKRPLTSRKWNRR